MRMTFLVGLTGGIASGKSTVADHFRRLGAEVIDTDAVAREVVAPGSEGLAAVVKAFGRTVLDADGKLDRRRMRERVFGDERARRRLEGILHPRIRALTLERARGSRAPYVVIVVPLLVESGWETMVHRVLVVDVPEETQIERVMQRDAATRQQAQAILQAQAGRERRLAVADDVIENSGSRGTLAEQTERLHRRYLELAASQ
ncbi:MAG: dephospho-CoA kinase [Ectothiorhodospiraceae bacterium]|jgi:dephospho-CoA kinase